MSRDYHGRAPGGPHGEEPNERPEHFQPCPAHGWWDPEADGADCPDCLAILVADVMAFALARLSPAKPGPLAVTIGIDVRPTPGFRPDLHVLRDLIALKLPDALVDVPEYLNNALEIKLAPEGVRS